MAIDRTGISSLDTGASDITYTGDEGPKSPEQQLMASADPMLVEEYEKYVFEIEEQGQTPMSFKEFVQQIMSGMAEGGIANPRLRPHTGSDLLAKKNSEGTRSKYQPPGHVDAPVHHGDVAHGPGGRFNQPAAPERRDPDPVRRDPDPVGGDQEADVHEMMTSMGFPPSKDDPGGPASRIYADIHGEWDDPGSVSYDPTYDPRKQSLTTKKSSFIGRPSDSLNFLPFSWGSEVNRRFFVNKVLGSKNYANINWEDLDEDELEKMYQEYMKARQMGDIDAYGNPSTPGRDRDPEWILQGYPSYAAWQAAQGGGGGTTAATTAATSGIPTSSVATGPFTNEYNIPGAANFYTNLLSALPTGQTTGVTFDPASEMLKYYSADGGRVPAAYGGIMDTTTGRKGYFLGSIFKKAKKAVKKIVKSDIGKAALMWAAFRFGPQFLSGTGFEKGLAGKGLPGWKKLLAGGMDPSKGGMNIWRGILGSSIVGGLSAEEEDDENDLYKKWLAQKKAADIQFAPVGDPANWRPIRFADGGRIRYDHGGYYDEDEEDHRAAALAAMYRRGAQEGGLMDLGGRIGYAGGSDDEVRAMERAAEDVKRTMHSFTEKRGPLYIDENYDLDVPLTEFEKELREMSKEEREDYLKLLESILRQRGNIGRDLGISEIEEGGKTGKERQMELLNWGTDRPSKDTGYFDDYSMRHRAAEYLDRPYSDEHYETGEHFKKGGRIGAQEGGLMDLGGMEKDYRQEGGFVPLGGEERADDVPARLSKNEFVFTADAVRAAGGGDIDAGAEIMENVMENLEEGGQVSEESQGLEGARDMFSTAQRLEGVL